MTSVRVLVVFAGVLALAGWPAGVRKPQGARAPSPPPPGYVPGVNKRSACRPSKRHISFLFGLEVGAPSPLTISPKPDKTISYRREREVTQESKAKENHLNFIMQIDDTFFCKDKAPSVSFDHFGAME